MSEENVETLRAAFAAFNRGDFDVVIKLAHPDFELVRGGGQSVVKGVAAFRTWMEPDAFEEQRYEPLDITASGNRVFVRLRFTGRGAGSGMDLDFTTFSVFTFDDAGLLTRLEGFLPHEEAEALEAAGLSE